MQSKEPLHVGLSSQTGIIMLSESEDLFYDGWSLSLIQHYDFTLGHLKAVYEIGLKELLKSECLIALAIPQGYTIGDFIAQVKQDHNHSKESLREHLRALLLDVVTLANHTRNATHDNLKR